MGDLTEQHMDDLLSGYSGITGQALKSLIAEVRRHRAARRADATRIAEVVRAALHGLLKSEGMIDHIAQRVAEQLAAPALSAEERASVTVTIPADLASSVARAIYRMATVFRDDTGHSPEGIAVLQADADRLDAIADRLLGGGQPEQQPDWTPPSMRVGDPGPCTPMAHCWASGSAICQCGEATREGNCLGWRVASRLTDEQIRDAVAGVVLGGGQ